MLQMHLNFTTLWISKPKFWQTSFTTDKGFKNFFSSRFQLIGLLWRKVQSMVFYPPLKSLGEKPRNVYSNFLCMKKTIKNFFINFSVSCKMFASCCEYVSFCRLFYCMIPDIVRAKWANSFFRNSLRYWVAKLQWLVLNESPELNAPYH